MDETESSSPARVCLLVLSGLPASGKSTLAKILTGSKVSSPVDSGQTRSDEEPCSAVTHPGTTGTTQSIGRYPVSKCGVTNDCREKDNTFLENFRTFVISYDDLIPEEAEANLIKDSAESDWKTTRENIIQCVDRLIQCLLMSDKFSENISQSMSDNSLRDIFSNSVKSQWRSAHVKGDNSRPYVIIIDDNMYYRSMRYKYYQLSRNYGQGFCQVHISCTEDKAKLQNRNRISHQVPDDVIATMATKMEPPNSFLHPWEKHSIALESSAVLRNLNDITKLVHCALLDPVTPLEDDSETKETNRKICSENQVHQADQILRKLISRTLKQISVEKDKKEVQHLGKFCSVLKSDILKELREGHILVPVDMPTFDASKMEDSLFYKFVEEIFTLRIPK